MSDVERLEAELALAKELEKLEAARAAMHAGRTGKTIEAYRKACESVAGMRSAFRERFQVVTAPGDAAPRVETVKATGGVNRR